MTAVKNPLPSQVLINALRDPSYRPYCLRCDTFERMQSVGRLQWRCSCGGGHDARQELEALLRHPLPNGYSPKDATDVAPAVAAQTAAAQKFVVPGLRNAAEAIANMGGHVPGIAHLLKNMLASYRDDALRYRALRRGLVASMGENGELLLACDVGLSQDWEDVAEPLTEERAPFLTDDERADPNGTKPGGTGCLRLDAVDRIVDHIVTQVGLAESAS